MKRQYMKPAMRVVGIQQTHYICSGSNGAVGKVSNSEGITWKDKGFDSGDDDY